MDRFSAKDDFAKAKILLVHRPPLAIRGVHILEMHQYRDQSCPCTAQLRLVGRFIQGHLASLHCFDLLLGIT